MKYHSAGGIKGNVSFNRTYRRLHMILFVLIALLVPFALELLFDKDSRYWWQSILVLAIWSTVILIAYKTSPRAFVNKLRKKYISVYEDNCDPAKFLSSSDGVINKIRAPYETWHIWFLNYCCLAHFDCGNDSEAECLLQTMLDDLGKTKVAVERARKTIVIFPSLATLREKEVAVKSLDNAEAVLLEKPKKNSQDLLYISFQRKLMLDYKNNDSLSIIATWEEQRCHKDSSNRTKAIAAYRQSEEFKKLGNIDKEVELLRYVVTHGSKLLVGRHACSRLTDLRQQQA